jgi:hypothetical protein
MSTRDEQLKAIEKMRHDVGPLKITVGPFETVIQTHIRLIEYLMWDKVLLKSLADGSCDIVITKKKA